MSASLEACLPTDLQGPATIITRMTAGLSGAGVYRVEATGRAFVLKISDDDEPLPDWRHKRAMQKLASDAGLAPPVVHMDESRRAVLSAFVVDRSIWSIYGDPRTRETAIVRMGRMVRRLHELPLPHDVSAKEPRALLATLWSGLTSFALPAFVDDAVRPLLDEEAPPVERALVLSHNDVNPTNLVYDGENLLLLDWDTPGPNEPFYDLAALSVFLRMDDKACRELLAAYDGAPLSTLPDRFVYDRRLIAVLCGAMMLHLARQSGHVGAAGGETLHSTPALGEFYQQLRSGSVSVATGEGQWAFGLALVKASVGAP